MGVLDEILKGVREDVAARKRTHPEPALAGDALLAPTPPSFVDALRAGPGPRVIAEIKRASPSRGPLRPDLDPVAIARAYEAAGAVAISVVTEGRRFGGSLADLEAVARATRLPVLRKDFIVDRYQLLEARAAGAAAVLLIARALSDRDLADLMAEAREQGLACLVEVHTAEEALRLHVLQPDAVGVNNRDLDTLEVTLETARRLAPCLPGGAARVAESGIRRPADIAALEPWGYDAFLVGEALLAAPDPGAALRALLDPSAQPSAAP